MSKYSNKLNYGKSELERIVSMEVNDDEATLFIQDELGNVSTKEIPNKYWILSNRPLSKDNWTKLEGNLYYKWGIQFSSQKDFRMMKKIWSKYDILCVNNPKESLMIKDGLTYFKGLKPNEVTILCFDIEATGLEHDDNSKIVLISNTLRKNGVITKKLFSYEDYENCGKMVEAWSEWVREVDPSILCGHNIYSYDLPYITFCASKYGYDVHLGRNNSPLRIDNWESKFRVDGGRELHYNKIHIYGRELVDTMFLAQRYDIVTKKYESFGLKYIIEREGLTKPDRVFYDASQIRHKYMIPEEFQKIKEYCVDDGDDALALYDLMMGPFFYMTQSIPKSFQEVLVSASGSQINSILMRAYLQDRHSLPKASPAEDFEGAISFAIPGIYRNVFKIDVTSLYPSIMRQYRVYDESKDPHAYFLQMTEFFLSERLKNKKLYKETKDSYYDDMQAAQKIFANSLYGFMGASGLCFNSPKNAALVTEKGREVLSLTIKWATGIDASEWIQQFKEVA